MNIAFIGLGIMGGPMAANLARAGHTVVGCDLSADRIAALEAAGGRGAGRGRGRPARHRRRRPGHRRRPLVRRGDRPHGRGTAPAGRPGRQHRELELSDERADVRHARPGELLVRAVTEGAPGERPPGNFLTYILQPS